ncbi:MAG: hypothetical protein JNM18_08180 [Planctomycetaceae bacterium]|nr:hypothetical protein [Planctomycetaceae bacterium]
MSSASSAPSSTVHVAVSLVHYRRMLLLIYNRSWHSFTFPMTRLRDWELAPTSPYGPDYQNAWLDAAAHAMAECSGVLTQPVDPNPGVFAAPATFVDRSARTGDQHLYKYKVFYNSVATPFVSHVQPYLWLPVEDIRLSAEQGLRPLSPTVLHLLNDSSVKQEITTW